MTENSKESKENETRWIFRDSMVEDLIEALEASKTEYEGRGLDFEGNLVKLYSQLRKHSCRSEVSYRSHVITSYFQTGLM